MAHIPADQTSKRELIQKKLIVCPISSQEPANIHQSTDGGREDAGDLPVSVTLKKNVIVMTRNASEFVKLAQEVVILTVRQR